MASGVDATLQDGGVEHLPALHEGRSSLVSPSSARQLQTPTPRERASEWAADIRRNINMYVDRHEDVNEDDIMSLKQEVVKVLINTLQQDSRDAWVYLCEVLQLLEGYREYLDYFETRAEFHHYLERILHHVQVHRERLFDLQVEQHLNRVFPEEMEVLKQQGARPLRDYCPSVLDKSANNPMPMPSTLPAGPLRKHKHLKLRLPDGTYPYSAHVLNDKQILGAQGLTFGDLRQSMGNVAFEMAARDSIWNSCLGTTALAVSTNIPEEPKGIPKTEEEEEVRRLSTKTVRRARPTPRKDHYVEIPLMTGREAVQFFASCNHSGKIKSLYFNLAPSRHFAPYDLISVPKAKINPEHYVFSSFGVLHVYPDQPAESMTLAQWQRSAVLWKAISAIPFFKHYLMRKAFSCWRSNKLYLDYQRHQLLVADNLLHNVPTFGAGLLQISRLLKELITVQFLPFETDKTYQLTEYENNINYKNIQAEQILEKFFRYCKLVVDTTAEESFKKMKYCEEQVKKKTFFSKDSLHLQKVKKEERERNLQKAKTETGRLGNFVKLVDQMVVEHLFHITKTQVLAFTDTVLAIGPLAPRDGFFKANLVFNKQDVLCLSPSKEKFQRSLSSTLRGIPAVLCSKAIAMDGSLGSTQDKDKDSTQQIDPKASGSQINLDLKSMSASQISSRKHDSLTGATSERESQVWEGAADSSIIEQEPSVAVGPVSSRTADDSFPVPSLPHIATPTKSEDDLGVATPDLVLTSRNNEGLAVEGEGFLGQYSPLSHASLEDKLAMDAEYQAALKVQQDLMKAALDEIDSYCEFNHWLNEIHVYCRRWNDKSAKEFRGAAAFTIEQKLTELRQWSEKVRNFDRNFISENGMFFLDCSAIHEGLLPRLNDIYQELITFVADEAKNLAANFVDEMKVIAKNMKDKRENVESFAQFAKNYQQYKKNTLQYQQRVEYIKSLYEVIRMSYRQLTSEEEKVEEGVWAAWEAFLMQMQDAGEFINTQTPLMAQQLETSFQNQSPHVSEDD